MQKTFQVSPQQCFISFSEQFQQMTFLNCVYALEDCGNLPTHADVVDSKLSTTFCNANEVSHLLRNRNPNKSPDSDHLPPQILKECALGIAPFLRLLLNRSLLAGEVPYPWKIAKIVPVHKKGGKDCRQNYRQISLTSIACNYKVSEKIVKDLVVNFWQTLKSLTQTNLVFF